MGTTTITIILVDDNQPRYSPDSYVFELSEDSLSGVVFGSVSASDLDEGDRFLFALASTSHPFTVNQLSGQLSLTEPLDRETVSVYNLTVLLTRSTSPFSLFDSTASVTVTVLDVNDNSPLFNQRLFEFVVSEATDVGETVGGVLAVDEDAGLNGDVEYLLNGVSEFSVDAVTGDIVIESPLDREMEASYEFTVTARDGGSPPRSNPSHPVSYSHLYPSQTRTFWAPFRFSVSHTFAGSTVNARAKPANHRPTSVGDRTRVPRSRLQIQPPCRRFPQGAL